MTVDWLGAEPSTSAVGSPPSPAGTSAPAYGCASEKARERTPDRTLTSYLLMPRPKDAMKALVMPTTFVMGALAARSVDGHAVARAVVVWLAIELLVYQARYQWNDIRGFTADQSHPDGGRGRLPGPLSRAGAHITASGVVALGRLALAASLVLLLPGLDLGGILLASAAGVLGVAVVYEVLRGVATGRTDHAPAPVRPAIAGLWLAVGAGYAVRGLTGLWLAVDLSDRPVVAVWAAVACWAAGIAFVTSRWVLETMPFAELADGRARWRATRAQAREHTLALVHWVDPAVDPRDLPRGQGLDHWRALHGRTPLLAPWNVASVVAGGASALAGRLLAGPVTSAGAGLALVAGALAALTVVLAARRRAIVLVAAAVALVGLHAVVAAPTPPLLVLPWIATMLVHVSSTSQSSGTLGRPLHRWAAIRAARHIGAGRSAGARAR